VIRPRDAVAGEVADVAPVAGSAADRPLPEAGRDQGRLEGRKLVVLGALVTSGLARSVDRQRVWKNNDVFFDALVRDAPNSYRAHFLRARLLGSEGRMRETEAEYHRAIRLFPYDVAMMLSIAADYHRSGACVAAIPMFTWSFVLEPTATQGRVAYVECLAHENRWTEARAEALKALSLVPGSEMRPLRIAIARADSALGRHHGR